MSEADGPGVPASFPAGRAVALGIVALVAGVLGARWASGTFLWEIWSDRDLARAVEVTRGHVTLRGAELSFLGEARVPGGAYAALLALPLLVDPDPLTAYRWGLALHALAVLLLGVLAARRHGALAGAVAAATLALTAADWRVREVLWNPTFLPLPVTGAVLAAHAVVVGRRPGAWVVLAACLAVGAQIHLSVAGWGLLLVGALATTRPAWSWGALGGALGIAVLLYLPWLVDVAGGPLPPLRLPGVDRAPAAVLGSVLDELFPGAHGRPGAVALLALGWVLPALAAPWLLADGPSRRLARALAAASVGWLALVALGLGQLALARYGVVTLPALAWLAAAGVAGLQRRTRRPWIVGAAAVLVAAAQAATVRPWLSPPRGELHDHATREAVLHHLEASLGSPGEVAARTVLRRDPEVALEDDLNGLAYPLARAEEAFPGSGAPPCAVVLPRTASGLERPSDDTLVAWLGPHHAATWLRAEAVGTEAVVHWVRTEGPCPTNLSNRYVDTPAEAVLRTAWPTLACGGDPLELPSPGPGVRRLAVLARGGGHGSRCVGVPLLLDVSPSGEGLDVVLHANALRGRAFFDGWHASATLLLEEPTPLRLGLGGVATPVRLHVPAGDAPALIGRLRLRDEPAPTPEGWPLRLSLPAPH